jgi:hypothetical protein
MKKRAVTINLEREAKAIRRLQERAVKRFVDDVVEIGKRLARVKAQVGHGEFTGWLRKNFQMSEATAQRYMSVGRLVGKNRTLRVLDLSALYLLVNQPPEVVDEFARRAQFERVTRETIKNARIVPSLPVPEPMRRTVVVPHYVDEEPPPTRSVGPAPEPPDPVEVPPADDGNVVAFPDAAQALRSDAAAVFLDAIAEYLPRLDDGALANAYRANQPNVSADEISRIGYTLVRLADKLRRADASWPTETPPSGLRH